MLLKTEMCNSCGCGSGDQVDQRCACATSLKMKDGVGAGENYVKSKLTVKERLIQKLREFISETDEDVKRWKSVPQLMKRTLDQYKILLDAFEEYKALELTPPATPIKIWDPRTKQTKVVHIVDFAAMSSYDVYKYDGRYGGEEEIRAKERITNPKAPLSPAEDFELIWGGSDSSYSSTDESRQLL